jgi:hypothetical protein
VVDNVHWSDGKSQVIFSFLCSFFGYDINDSFTFVNCWQIYFLQFIGYYYLIIRLPIRFLKVKLATPVHVFLISLETLQLFEHLGHRQLAPVTNPIPPVKSESSIPFSLRNSCLLCFSAFASISLHNHYNWWFQFTWEFIK